MFGGLPTNDIDFDLRVLQGTVLGFLRLASSSAFNTRVPAVPAGVIFCESLPVLELCCRVSAVRQRVLIDLIVPTVRKRLAHLASICLDSPLRGR